MQSNKHQSHNNTPIKHNQSLRINYNQSIIKHKYFNQPINPYLSKSLISKRPKSLLMEKNVSLGSGFVIDACLIELNEYHY